MRRPWAACAAAALVLDGCSFVAVRRPPSVPPGPGEPLECTQSRVAPGLDTAGAFVTPVLGLASWGLCAFMQTQQSWASDPQDLRCRRLLWATLAGTAVYAGSAVYGFHETGECRRLAAQQVPPPWPPPPWPPPQGAPPPAGGLPPHLAPAPPASGGALPAR